MLEKHNLLYFRIYVYVQELFSVGGGKFHSMEHFICPLTDFFKVPCVVS